MKYQEAKMLDIEGPFAAGVEVLTRFDGKVLWVNVDGKCLLRICQIDPRSAPIVISDERVAGGRLP